MRVLLIAQDGATQASVRTMLAREKFDTTEIDHDSLEISRLDDYDVIVLDLSLPRINGYQVLKQLRRERVRTPVLIRWALPSSIAGSKVSGLVSATCLPIRSIIAS